MYPNLTTRCQKVDNIALHTNSKLFTTKFDVLKIGVPDFSAQDGILTKKFLADKISSRGTSSPVGKIRISDFYQFRPSLSL